MRVRIYIYIYYFSEPNILKGARIIAGMPQFQEIIQYKSKLFLESRYKNGDWCSSHYLEGQIDKEGSDDSAPNGLYDYDDTDDEEDEGEDEVHIPKPAPPKKT